MASEFEYRHRFAIIALVFIFAYAFYNLDHLNIVYAIAPRNLGVLDRNVLARFVYGVSALLAGIGAAILTWASAYRLSSPRGDQPQTVALLVGGPYRYVRNPYYMGYFLLVVALGSFQSRLGFPIPIAAETLLFLRLIAHEEMQLDRQYGERSHRVFVRMCKALVCGFAKASTTTLDSLASSLTAVLS